MCFSFPLVNTGERVDLNVRHLSPITKENIGSLCKTCAEKGECFLGLEEPLTLNNEKHVEKEFVLLLVHVQNSPVREMIEIFDEDGLDEIDVLYHKHRFPVRPNDEKRSAT